MRTSAVSFGRVLALSGKESKINKVNSKLNSKKQAGEVIVRDVTKYYKYAPSDGLMAQAAQRGDKVDIYVTGDDVKKFGKEKGWLTMDEVLSHLTNYYDIAKMSIGEAVETVMKG